MPSELEKLRAEPVLTTARRLQERIDARFPERGLNRVAGEMVILVEKAASGPITSRRRTVRAISRGVMVVVVLAGMALVLLALRDASGGNGPDHSFEWVQFIESGVNDIVFAAIAVWFLWSVPERLQRSAALGLLHRMRSLAHIVDMHQLTKDPERLRKSFRRTPKSAAPLDLTAEELEHYLDYCSELLSLVGKAAALCAEECQDSVVLATVSTIETLTVEISGKIWQKIQVLQRFRPD